MKSLARATGETQGTVVTVKYTEKAGEKIAVAINDDSKAIVKAK